MWTGPNAFNSTDQNPTIVGATTLASGIYTVAGTIDATGCTSFNTVNVTVNPVPTIDAVDTSFVTSCIPPYDGTITITATGTNLEYSIDGGTTFQAGNVFTGLDNITVYDIIVSNSITGCSTILDSTIILSNTSGPSIDSVITVDVDCYGGTTGQLVIHATDATQYSIDNGSNYFVDSTFTGLSEGTYNIMVMDAGNCQDIYVVTINEPTELLTSFTDSTSILCYGDSNGSITVTPSGGTPGYTYFWDGGSTPTDSIATGLSIGTYNVTVTDNNGCTSVDNITISEPTELLTSFTDSTSILCYGNTGSVTVTPSGGTPGYTYLWDGGSTPTDSIAIGLLAGIYNVTVTDNNGCTNTDNITITEPDSLSLNINTFNNATCGGSDGMATATVTGGTFPYNYLWNDPLATTDTTVTGLSSGTYTVYVSDDNGCNDSLSIFIDNQGGGTISIDYVHDVLCYEDTNGAIVVTISSGTPDFIFYWSTNDTVTTSSYSDTLAHLVAGNYSVTVMDDNGCSSDTVIIVNGPTAPLTAPYTVIDVSCYGLSDGEIHMNTTGGTPGYTYIWAPSGGTENNNIYSGLPAVTFAVTVTDANGCSTTIPKIDVGEPDALEITFSGNMPLCYGYSDGICYVSASGGTEPYNFVWSEGTQGSTISNISTGEYYVTLTDENSCVKIDTLQLPPLEQILYTEEIINASCIGNNDGEITLEVYNGNSPFTYTWDTNPIQTDSSVTGLIVGIYEVTITDNDGCEIVSTFEILDGTTSCLIIPTLFTPNNDGINDNWELKGIWIQNDIHIEIYNRWGDVIFSHDGSGSEYDSSRWDGTCNGKELPISSYVYLIDLKDGNEVIQGIVTIKK